MNTKSPTVLLVDDDANLLESMRRALRREPYRLITADSAVVALSRLETEPVDLIVSDDQMPGLRGIDLLVEARRRRPDLVTLVLTGSASVGLAVRAVNDVGVFRFLTKPCPAAELAREIRAGLERVPRLETDEAVYSLEIDDAENEAWLDAMRVSAKARAGGRR